MLMGVTMGGPGILEIIVRTAVSFLEEGGTRNWTVYKEGFSGAGY